MTIHKINWLKKAYKKEKKKQNLRWRKVDEQKVVNKQKKSKIFVVVTEMKKECNLMVIEILH